MGQRKNYFEAVVSSRTVRKVLVANAAAILGTAVSSLVVLLIQPTRSGLFASLFGAGFFSFGAGLMAMASSLRADRAPASGAGRAKIQGFVLGMMTPVLFVDLVLLTLAVAEFSGSHHQLTLGFVLAGNSAALTVIWLSSRILFLHRLRFDA